MEPISTVDKLAEFAEICGGSVYEAYSGRFMYGALCWGVSVGHRLSDEQLHELCKACDVPFPSSDALGLGMIYYWPQYEYIAAQD